MTRTTIYFDSGIHKALRIKAAEVHRSMSDLVNEAMRDALSKVQDNLEVRESRPTSYQTIFKDLESVDKSLLEQAKNIPAKPSQTLEADLVDMKRKEEWKTENRDAINAYNRRIEKQGVFGDNLRLF